MPVKIIVVAEGKTFILTDESGAVYGRYTDKEEACARKEDWENYLNSAEGE